MQMFSRILLAGTLAVTSLFANAMDEGVISFEKKRFSQNKRINLKDVKISNKVQMPVSGWYGYLIDVTAEVQGKELSAKDMIFSNGEVIAPELFDMKTGESLKTLLEPKLAEKFYDKKHLIEGTHGAKDTIVVFSDPLCPFCMDYLPDVINHVKRNSKEIALYYYHFPLLQLHPAADTLVRLMHVARQNGFKDIELKVYQADWEKYFTEQEKNPQVIIDGFNKEFKTAITLENINETSVKQDIFKDIQMGEEAMVRGTPTIFINGLKDKSKNKYETLGK